MRARVNPIPEEGVMCHRTGFTRSCKEIVVAGQCRLWTHVQGLHPQSGEQIDSYDCADAWLPMLMIENSQQQRQTGAAVESFRNEMVALNGADIERLIEGN